MVELAPESGPPSGSVSRPVFGARRPLIAAAAAPIVLEGRYRLLLAALIRMQRSRRGRWALGVGSGAVVTLLALLVFGFVKGRFTGTRPVRSALQTALIGSLAAGAAFAIARLIGG